MDNIRNTNIRNRGEVWMIVCTDEGDEGLFWSNTDGWTDPRWGGRWTDAERVAIGDRLGDGMAWITLREVVDLLGYEPVRPVSVS